MKKMLIAAIALALLATPVFAGKVRNSKHDLSFDSSGATLNPTAYSEVCVFCHTPHGAKTGILAPLWNRSYLPEAGYDIADLYNSATLEEGFRPNTVVAAVNDSDARLCMSCHDGLSAVVDGVLLNPANSSNNDQPVAVTGKDGALPVTNNANLGADLKNDHPIGMNYIAVQMSDGGLIAADASGLFVGEAEVKLYTTEHVMWCSTCHDVHDNDFPPFLTMTNSASKLCSNCHNK